MTPKLPLPSDATLDASPVVVGIDPGDVTGLAVWSPAAERFLYVGSGHFFQVLTVIGRHVRPLHNGVNGAPDAAESASGRDTSVQIVRRDLALWTAAAVVVEDNRRLPIYARNAAAKGPARDKLCRNVGRVDRDVELWEKWLTPRGYDLQLVPPGRGTKWDAETLARLSGWSGPTNEHARDAARLAFGRTVAAASQPR